MQATAAWSRTIHDPARIGAVRRTGLAEGIADPALDRLAALAAGIANAPIAVVSIVGEEALHLAGAYGLRGALEQSRTHPIDPSSICARVVDQRAAIARNDLEPRDGGYPIRSVASVPFFDVDGYALGGICVLDTEQRAWGDELLDRMLPVAQLVGRELRLAATMPADRRNYRLGVRPPTRQEWMPRMRAA